MGAGNTTAEGSDSAPMEADERYRLAELAVALSAWPASNPVARKALDRARDEVLALARGELP